MPKIRRALRILEWHELEDLPPCFLQCGICLGLPATDHLWEELQEKDYPIPPRPSLEGGDRSDELWENGRLQVLQMAPATTRTTLTFAELV